MEKNSQNQTYYQCQEPKSSHVERDECGQGVTGIEAYCYQGTPVAQGCTIQVGLRRPDCLGLSSLSPDPWPEKIGSPGVEPYRASRN